LAARRPGDNAFTDLHDHGLSTPPALEWIEKTDFETANPTKTHEPLVPIRHYAIFRAATFLLSGMDVKIRGLVVMVFAALIPTVTP